MTFSHWLDRFANTAVIIVLLSGLPLAAIGFVSGSL
jgi:hypothetical protein